MSSCDSGASSRNLSFDVDDSELESFFTNFGEILFARVVKDHGTQHSKGSGFVKFVKKEDCANVLLDSAKGENFQKFTLRGRTLDLRLAISREAARQTSSSKEVTSEQIFESEAPCVPGAPLEDINLSGRNLHLASLGMIRPGSKAAEGLSGHDLAKRDALLRSKKCPGGVPCDKYSQSL
ncbi:unnamed protein product [Protopolystoma xenopodis]|uniref:RRM domain-containing protein n=1 Tax=Protopolystoma xenopodis TaxID=117903 RepID=A0A448XP96_9PLAT|nr:unnamed protein product [Protopolystoma xenopodis]